MDLEENGRGLLQVLSLYLFGGTEENHGNLNQYSQCSRRHSNRASLGCKSTALPVDQDDWQLTSKMNCHMVIPNLDKKFSTTSQFYVLNFEPEQLFCRFCIFDWCFIISGSL
jgi:hypothetical protein